MTHIAYLVDHPETIPTLTDWFRAQWPDYFAGRTPADIAQDFYAEANHTGLPVRLVAFAGGALAGTITLRDQAIQTLPKYHPGLGRTVRPAAVSWPRHRHRVGQGWHEGGWGARLRKGLRYDVVGARHSRAFGVGAGQDVHAQ